jgi:hypothetical protein
MEPTITANTAYTLHLTLSNNCSHIAFFKDTMVSLYDVQAQRILCSHIVHDGMYIRFSPDGHQLWVAAGDGLGSIALLVKLGREDENFVEGSTEDLSDWSWVNLFSPHSWQVGTESEWVVDSQGMKLLWLPVSWRTRWHWNVRWDGKFLAFVCSTFLNPVIIQFQL